MKQRGPPSNQLTLSIYNSQIERSISMSKKHMHEEQVVMDFIQTQDLHCFGMSNEDAIAMRQQLQHAKHNHITDVFPDFYIPDGFVEHFRITSSNESSKGSRQKREDDHCNQALDEMLTSATQSQCQSQSTIQHTHEYFLKSLQKNWDSHANSFQKYTGKQNVSAFLLDYEDNMLYMYQQTGRKYDTSPESSLPCYFLSRDAQALSWIYANHHNVQYVLFTNHDIVECIKIQSIPALLKNISKYCIKGMHGLHTTCVIKIPI